MNYLFPSPKDPSDVADYHLDWSGLIGREKLASSAIVVAGVTLITNALDSRSKGIQFRLSGGVIDIPALIDCTVTTESTQTFQADIVLRIKQRVFQFAYPKDPSDVADYYLDWFRLIGKEKLISKNISAVGVNLVGSEMHSKSKGLNFRVNGGSVGIIADIDCTVATDTGQAFHAVFKLKVEQR